MEKAEWEEERAKDVEKARKALLQAIQTVVRPRTEQMAQDSWKWMNENNYEQILDVDVARLSFAQNENKILQEMKADKESKENELAMSDQQENNIQDRIEQLEAKEDEMEDLKQLLRSDMLDLNYIEQKIMATLKVLNWEENKIVEKLLFSQKDKLGFKSG